MWQGRTGNGHVAQEQEPDALDKVRSLPMVQTPHFGTLSLPKNRINSQLCWQAIGSMISTTTQISMISTIRQINDLLSSLILPESNSSCDNTADVRFHFRFIMLQYLVKLGLRQSIPGCRFKDPKPISRMGGLKRNIVTKQGESNDPCSPSKLYQFSAKLVLIFSISVAAVVLSVDFVSPKWRPTAGRQQLTMFTQSDRSWLFLSVTIWFNNRPLPFRGSWPDKQPKKISVK